MASGSSSYSSPGSGSGKYIPGLRWWICGLLFIATTINYIDRNALAVLQPMLEEKLHWTKTDYGWILFAFSTAYALFPSFAGVLIDRLGVKTSFAAGVILWSLMCAAHAIIPLVATTPVMIIVGFCVARFLLGAAETTNFPASIKATAQWFPQKERAVATGLFNSGSNVAVMIAILPAWLAEKFGWQLAFIIIGLFGFVWLIAWFMLYRNPDEHPSLDPRELEYIRSDQPQAKEKLHVHWTELLRHGQIWPFLIAKFLTDPVWWFFLFFLPPYLHDQRGMDVMGGAYTLFYIYTGATVGSIVGGWVSGYLMKRGMTVGSARYLAMLLCVVCMPGAIVAYYTSNVTLCIVLIALATGSHQGWSANLFTSATDLFPEKVAGSVVGLGQTTGAIGGMFMSLLVALAIEWTRKQQIPFIWAGLMHPLSLAIFFFWIGKNYHTVDVDKPVDMARTHAGLLWGGILVALAGAGLFVLVRTNWELCVEKGKISGAWGAATAAVGIVIIGAVLIYAAIGKNTTRQIA